MSALMNALQTGNHERYVSNPETLDLPESIEDGNAILGHVLGSKDVSRNIAGFASQRTGIDASILKQMLPMLGAAVMGVLAQQMLKGRGQPGTTGAAPSRGGGSALEAMLKSFLDADKDGSMMDDLLGLAQRFFQQRRS